MNCTVLYCTVLCVSCIYDQKEEVWWAEMSAQIKFKTSESHHSLPPVQSRISQIIFSIKIFAGELFIILRLSLAISTNLTRQTVPGLQGDLSTTDPVWTGAKEIDDQ